MDVQKPRCRRSAARKEFFEMENWVGFDMKTSERHTGNDNETDSGSQAR